MPSTPWAPIQWPGEAIAPEEAGAPMLVRLDVYPPKGKWPTYKATQQAVREAIKTLRAAGLVVHKQ